MRKKNENENATRAKYLADGAVHSAREAALGARGGRVAQFTEGVVVPTPPGQKNDRGRPQELVDEGRGAERSGRRWIKRWITRHAL